MQKRHLKHASAFCPFQPYAPPSCSRRVVYVLQKNCSFLLSACFVFESNVTLLWLHLKMDCVPCVNSFLRYHCDGRDQPHPLDTNPQNSPLLYFTSWSLCIVLQRSFSANPKKDIPLHLFSLISCHLTLPFFCVCASPCLFMMEILSCSRFDAPVGTHSIRLCLSPTTSLAPRAT